MFESAIVWFIVGLSVSYLAWQVLKSVRGKGKGHCSGCSKE